MTVFPGASAVDVRERLARGEKIASIEQMSPEYYAALLNLLQMQADSELAGGIGYMPWIAKAPGVQEKLVVASIVKEEIGHANLIYNLLRKLEFDVDAHVAAHQWELRVDNGNIGTDRLADDRRVNIFYYPIDTWADFIMFNFTMDRGAGHQLYDAEHCSYAPWNRAIGKIAAEEAGHMHHGDSWVQRLAQNPETHDDIQAALDRWYPRVMNIFGRPNTPKNRLYREFGLKVRDNDDVRRAFVEDVQPKVDAWGLQLPEWTPPWEDAGQPLVYEQARDEARWVAG